MPRSLFLDSLGLTDKINRETGGPPLKSTSNDKSATIAMFVNDQGNDSETDDDSLWNDVIPDEALPCAGEGDEDHTLEITNRGSLTKPEILVDDKEHQNRNDDESIFESLTSTDSDSVIDCVSDCDSDSSASSGDSSMSSDTGSSSSESYSGISRIGDGQSSLVFLCEHINDKDEEMSSLNSHGESSFGSIDNDITAGYQEIWNRLGPPSTTECHSIKEESRSHDGQISLSSMKKTFSGDESREGAGPSSTHLITHSLQEPRESQKLPVSRSRFGFSIRKQRSMFAIIKKDKTKKASRKLLSFGKSSKSSVADSATTVQSENTTTHNTSEERMREHLKVNQDQVVVLMEEIVLRPDYRGRLTKQSNLDELVRSIDPNDCRHCVLGVSDGFEVLRPSHVP